MFTECITESEWLDIRRHHIASSEVAAALGESKWKSPYTLWAEKTRRVEPRDTTISMRVRYELEDLIVELYKESQLDLVNISNPGDYTVLMRPEWPFLSCTLDRVIHAEDVDIPLELKTTSRRDAETWRAGDPPIEAVAQIQIRMLLMGAPRGVLAALVDGADFVIVDVDRDQPFLDAAIPKLRQFWNLVHGGNSPEIDGSDSTRETIGGIGLNRRERQNGGRK